MSDSTYLYRHFNSSGELLYVGISINAFDRYKQHANEKEWIDEVANMTIERFPCRGDALLAESSAIVKEKPKYNIAGNPLANQKRPAKVVEKPVISPLQRLSNEKLNELHSSLIKFVSFLFQQEERHEEFEHYRNVMMKAHEEIGRRIILGSFAINDFNK